MKHIFTLISISFTLAVANAQDTLTVAGTDTSHGIRVYKMLDFSKGFAKRYYAQKWDGSTTTAFMLSNFHKNIYNPKLYLKSSYSKEELNNMLSKENLYRPDLPYNDMHFHPEIYKYNQANTLLECLLYFLVVK